MVRKTRRTTAGGTQKPPNDSGVANENTIVGPKVSQKQQRAIDHGAGAGAAYATAQKEPPQQQCKRTSKLPREERGAEHSLQIMAGQDSEGLAEASAEVPQQCKRPRRQAALQPPATLCFSPNQTAVRIGTSGYK